VAKAKKTSGDVMSRSYKLKNRFAGAKRLL